jgi:hypothetical protein
VVTVLLLPHGDVPAELADRVLHALEQALDDNRQLDVKDAGKLLADFAGEVPTDDVDAARKLAKEGEDLLADMRPREALDKLGDAVRRLESVMPFIHKQEVAEATLSLAVAQALEGNRAAARSTFAQLLVWRPRMETDSTRIPPDLMPLYDDARREVARLPRGSVEIVSDPPGAVVYVDGRLVGSTPTTAEGLTVGTHFVTCKREGYVKLVTRAQVSAHLQQTVRVSLERSRKYLLLAQSIERSQNAFGAPQAVDAMVDLRTFLYIDQVVFVRLERGAEGQVGVDAALYDVRSRRRLSQVHRSFLTAPGEPMPGERDSLLTPPGERMPQERQGLGTASAATPALVERGAGELASALYLGVPYDGQLLLPLPEQPPPAAQKRSIYTRWWFWTALGAAAAAAIVIPLSALPEDRSTPGYRPGTITWSN